MIIVNLSCSGYVVEVNGEQVSVVGLNTEVQHGKNTMHPKSVSALIKLSNGLTL